MSSRVPGEEGALLYDVGLRRAKGVSELAVSSTNAFRGQLNGPALGIMIRTLSMRGEMGMSGLPLSKIRRKLTWNFYHLGKVQTSKSCPLHGFADGTTTAAAAGLRSLGMAGV